jgi:hypothetical protein
MKSGFCACAITFQMQSIDGDYLLFVLAGVALKAVSLLNICIGSQIILQHGMKNSLYQHVIARLL